jgi:cation diffusion facilitator family transporter
MSRRTPPDTSTSDTVLAVAASNPQVERRGLLVSIAVTAVLGAIGIVWGIIGGSQMILLDGVYAVIGIAVSFLLLGASALAATPPSRRFPYGRAGATPLVIAIQGLVLAATLVYAGVGAVFTIVDGGSDIDAGWGVAYGALSAVASLIVWVWLARQAGSSDLLRAESTAWKVAALRGFGMVVGFTVLALLTGSRWDGAAPYVDPAMVLVTCVVFLPAPYRMVRVTVGEVMEAAPPGSVRVPVIEVIERVREVYDLDEPTIRLNKLGPRLYVEVDVTVGPEVTVEQQHEVRVDLEQRLTALPYDVWLTLEMLPRPLDPTEPPDEPDESNGAG